MLVAQGFCDMEKNVYDGVGDGFDSRLGHKETPVKSGVSIKDLKSRAKSRAALETAKPYKPAKLYHGNHAEWYIEYYYLKPDGSGWKRIKERFDIGRIRTRYGDDAAIIYGQECCRLLNNELAAGMNPFERRIKKTAATAYQTLHRLVQKMAATASVHAANAYREHLNRLARFMPVIQQPGFSISDFSRTHADQYISAMDAAQLAPKTINGSIMHLQLFWKELQKNSLVTTNVWAQVDRLKKKVASTRYEPFTADELQQIFAHLEKSKQQHLLNFLHFIYYAWARPAELRKLRVGDIRLADGLIRFSADDTKNKKGAFVQIVPKLAATIEKMQLEKYPAEYYVFGKGKMAPGKQPLNKYSLVERWQQHVAGKLGTTKTMYALKHTGNIMYLLSSKNDVNIKWMQMQNRHSSPAMTEKYIRALGAYFIDTDQVNF